MAKAKIAIGATRWIGGKLMRWSGTAWKASRRKVGGELAKRKSSALAKKGSSAITKAKSSAITKSSGGKLTKTQSKSITKSSGGKLTTRNNKIKPSTTANTSRDTVKGSGTRTGQPGKNRNLLSASKPKPKPKPTMRSRLSSAWRNLSNEAWLRNARKGADFGLLNQTLDKPAQLVGNRWLRGGLNLAYKQYILDQGLKTAKNVLFPEAGILNDNILLDIANVAQVARGKRSLGKGRLAQLRNARLDEQAMLADEAAVSDQQSLAQSNAPVVPTTPAGSRLPGESTADFHGRLRADLDRDFPTQPKVQTQPAALKVKTQEKKTNKKIAVKQEQKKGPTAEELWIKKTANSPAAKAFSGEERWKLHIANQKWRKKMGRTYTHID